MENSNNKGVGKLVFIFVLLIATVVLGILYYFEKTKEPEVYMPDKLVTSFYVDGNSLTEPARGGMNFISDENYNVYSNFKILEVRTNDYAKECVLQAWNYRTNSADKLEAGISYSKDVGKYESMYVSTVSKEANKQARCIITVELSK